MKEEMTMKELEETLELMHQQGRVESRIADDGEIEYRPTDLGHAWREARKIEVKDCND